MRRFRNFHIIPFLFCLFTTLSATAQRISIHHPQLRFLFEDSLLQSPTYHSALQPLEISVGQLKSTYHSSSSSQKSFFISPVIDAAGGYSFKTKEYSYQLGQGTYMAGNFGKKAGFELSAVLYEQKFPGESYSIDSLKLVPRNNRPLWGKGERTVYGNIRGKVYWKANKWLTFSAGNDKHFFGDGQRSVLLSENAAAYPFFQTRLNIWKVNYLHQIMFMQDVVPGIKDKRFQKYASMHILSVNAAKRINFYIFEAVIWRKQDSIRHRGFDVNYLNPFLFYRPVEFNMGSPDNVLMGIGGKWILGKSSYFYGQFLIDEFKLKEIKANRGWWANKQAFQAGFKTFSLFGQHPSLFYFEYNQCRPFTYSHTFILQNYGYLNQSLAFPEQSNFREMISGLQLRLKKKWFLTLRSQALLKGSDPEGLNYGSNIYKDPHTFSKLYGNQIGQGIQRNILKAEIMLAHSLKPEWRIQGFVSTILTRQTYAGTSSFDPIFLLGIHTLIYE